MQVISTVVTFQAFVEVTLHIPFPAGHVAPVGITKSSTAEQLVPVFVTQASPHGSHVVVLPTVTVAAFPVSHLSAVLAHAIVTVQLSSLVNTISSPLKAAAQILAQSHQSSHFAPLGIVKFNTAALQVQVLVTQAQVPDSHVVVVHTVIVAAAPSSHFAPCGMVKSNIAAQQVPELHTHTLVHGSHVVTQPTSIVAALPVSHFKSFLAQHNVTVQPLSLVNTISSQQNSASHILAPVAHVQPVAPCGIVKLNIAAQVVPELVIQASLQAAPVHTVPRVIVAASPVSHLSHFRSSIAII